MLTSIRTRLGRMPQGPWLLGSAIALAVLVAPFAVADDTGSHSQSAGHPTVLRLHCNDDFGVAGRNVHAHGGIAAIEVLQQE